MHENDLCKPVPANLGRRTRNQPLVVQRSQMKCVFSNGERTAPGECLRFWCGWFGMAVRGFLFDRFQSVVCGVNLYALAQG